jgi:glycosyltransferase involved in cell wall biosynthesis
VSRIAVRIDRMRVLFSLLDARLGGGQSVAISIADRLVAEGHTVGVLVPSVGHASERFAVAGATVHTADLHSLRRVGSVWRVARALRSYDVLYSHTSIPGEILGDVAARIARKQHVVHRHTPPHLSADVPIRKVQATLYRLLLRRRSLIVVAPHIADGVVALGVPRRHITVIPNGVDPESLPSVRRRDPEDRLRIGVLGRVDPQKGMDVFAAAVQILQPQNLRARFMVGIARGGFPDVEGQVLAELQDAGVEVVTPGADGPMFLAGLDVVVMPSRWEGSPLTLFEALALGKPVIASDIPGIAEVMNGEEAGLLVSVADPSALADAIHEAIVDSSARAHWSVNALNLASRNTRDRASARAVAVLTSAAQHC